MTRLLLLALSCATLAAPAQAAERQLTVTSFDRIVVEGPFDVTVTTGRGSSARAIGDVRAIEGIAVRVTGRTMTVRMSPSTWGGFPGDAGGRARVEVSTPSLSSARLGGAGRLKVDRLTGGAVDIVLSGDGTMEVDQIVADKTAAAVIGAGALKLAGRSSQTSILLQGAGRVDGGALAADDLTVTSSGTGSATLAARRSAKVTANGSGMVEVTGGPACTVKASGSALVTC